MYILNDKGEPERTDDLMLWGRWLEDATRDRSRIVAQDRDEGPLRGDIRISTVFLGLDHNFSPHGPPVLWETMVFGGPLDGEMNRYLTRDEAFKGHQEMCKRVATALRNDAG